MSSCSLIGLEDIAQSKAIALWCFSGEVAAVQSSPSRPWQDVIG
jgi:hypothetical protein